MWFFSLLRGRTTETKLKCWSHTTVSEHAPTEPPPPPLSDPIYLCCFPEVLWTHAEAEFQRASTTLPHMQISALASKRANDPHNKLLDRRRSSVLFALKLCYWFCEECLYCECDALTVFLFFSLFVDFLLNPETCWHGRMQQRVYLTHSLKTMVLRLDFTLTYLLSIKRSETDLKSQNTWCCTQVNL